MKHIVPILAAALASVAQAEAPATPVPFEARVLAAKDAEGDERFRNYHAMMTRRAGRHIARTMRSCRALAPAPELKSIVLVADIDVDGKATAIETKPDNAAARCVAAGFSSIRYPKPPAYPEHTGFPVTLKISMAR